jgi:glycosyltransferase involved in cell wall biosynthesis
MISGRDFIVLSDDWSGLPTSTMHLFRIISQRNRVFWFNLVNRMPAATMSDLKRVASFARRWSRVGGSDPRSSGVGANNYPENLRVVTPFMLPWFKQPVRQFNRVVLGHAYRRMVSRFQIEEPIAVAVFPPAVDFLRSVDAAHKIYYCYDDFLEYPGFNVNDWRVMEAELLDHVDAVVVTAQELKQKCRRPCPTLHLPHGVDFEHFHRATVECREVPQMQEIRRPIAGFFGLISEWVDLGLIAWLSKRHPDISFVLIGKSEIPTTVLDGCPNVHLLGFVPYQDLPAYARHFDVGLIPFVCNKLTEAVNPLKLMEYFAIGLPVVATRLPELESIEGPLQLADTREQFSHLIVQALNSPKEQTRSAALAAAGNNTWEHRVEELGTFIHQLGREKHASAVNASRRLKSVGLP